MEEKIEIPQLLEQDIIQDFIARSITIGRIPHAIIINGASNGGKLEIAKYLAYSISGDPDICLVDFSDNSLGYVDVIRFEVIEKMSLLPYRNSRKVFIINEADRMTKEAQNALLKSLEEPPEYAVIILLCENNHKLLPTIRSRTVSLNLKNVEKSKIIEYLICNKGISRDEAIICAELSGGNVNKALLLCEKKDYIDTANRLSEIFAKLSTDGKSIYLDYKEEIKELSQSMDIFLELMEIFIRDVLVYKSAGNKIDSIYSGWKSKVMAVANSKSLSDIGKIEKSLVNIRRAKQHNVYQGTLVDTFFYQLS